jgi:pimeloyl-ACP methyl ester carboxylesterase
MIPEPAVSFISTNGLALEVARAGPEDGPAVVLLHGFPETWWCWRHQIGPLAEAGYHVLAPNQRGYGRSDKPDRIADYALDRLADDVAGLIAAAGRERAALIGHDWGGLVAWWMTLRHPDRVDRLIILNAAHSVAYLREVRRRPNQMFRSWYVGAFQIPRLPEILLRRRQFRPLARVLRQTSRPGTFTDDDLDRYRAAWSEPGALRAMIHWYRAAVRARPPLPDDPRIRVPTLIIWGVRDRFLDRALADASLALCERGRLDMLEGATHWVQHEEPAEVNRRLLEFLGGGD